MTSGDELFAAMGDPTVELFSIPFIAADVEITTGLDININTLASLSGSQLGTPRSDAGLVTITRGHSKRSIFHNRWIKKQS